MGNIKDLNKYFLCSKPSISDVNYPDNWDQKYIKIVLEVYEFITKTIIWERLKVKLKNQYKSKKLYSNY